MKSYKTKTKKLRNFILDFNKKHNVKLNNILSFSTLVMIISFLIIENLEILCFNRRNIDLYAVNYDLGGSK